MQSMNLNFAIDRGEVVGGSQVIISFTSPLLSTAAILHGGLSILFHLSSSLDSPVSSCYLGTVRVLMCTQVALFPFLVSISFLLLDFKPLSHVETAFFSQCAGWKFLYSG